MSNRIITGSVVEVKATAALSKQIAKELEQSTNDKDLKEILNEHQHSGGDDRRRSNDDNK